MLGMKHGSQAIPEQMSVLRRGQRARGTAHIIVVFSHVTMLASFKILFLFNSSWVDNHSVFFSCRSPNRQPDEALIGEEIGDNLCYTIVGVIVIQRSESVPTTVAGNAEIVNVSAM